MPVPGTGRIAVRYFAEDLWDGCFSFEPCHNSGTVEIDTLTVGPVATANPPMPQPGQSVTWTAAGGPYEISGQPTIPPGSTVEIEPGTVIEIPEQQALRVEGTLIAHGTAGAPIIIIGAPSWLDPPVLVLDGGLAEWQHVQFNGRLSTQRGGSTIVRDSSFPGGILATGGIGSGTRYLQVESSSFSGGAVSVVDGQLAIRDCTFEGGGGVSILRGFLLLDDVQIDGGSLGITRQESPHTTYIDTLNVTNFAGPALHLEYGNSFLGAQNQLSGNLYPLQLAGGLAPGSTLPASGNTNDVVRVLSTGGPSGTATWPALPVPYLIEPPHYDPAPLTVLPGAEIIGAPGAMILADHHRFDMLGHPDAPIVLRAASGSWAGVTWFGADPSNVEYCTIEEATTGFGVSNTTVPFDNCLIRNNDRGISTDTFAIAIVRGSRLLDNTVGARGTDLGSLDLAGAANPNWIEGNGQGVVEDDPTDARHNWWGDPSGPMHPDNPGGSGDSASGALDVIPFLTAPPDLNDRPPLVRMQPLSPVVEEGSTIHLHWTVEEHGSVVSQRVLFGDALIAGAEVLAAGIPGSQRSVEITVPESFFHNGVFVVEATDDAGQSGFDQRYVLVGGPPPAFGVQTPAGPFVQGEPVEVVFSGNGGEVFLLLEALHDRVGQGGTNQTTLTFDAPFVSTANARVGRRIGEASWAFSDFFEIRPDARMWDEPPSVTLLTPSGGAVAGGSTVHVTWSGSDDEALRSFDLLGSYDNGRTWHAIVSELPGSATSHSWQLPPSAGVADARLRIIARDLRFQDSGDTVMLTITPGAGGDPVTGDANGDGVVNVDDVVEVIAGWGPCPAPPQAYPCDLDASGAVDVNDLVMVIVHWGG